jgi:hypothetical protein
MSCVRYHIVLVHEFPTPLMNILRIDVVADSVTSALGL